jgi:cellulose biosynthesis protein BcsQ
LATHVREQVTLVAAPRGEIITFYSYKGGTGRTMALANVACLLADRIDPQEKVLVVDWDLEAPGLHRFFPGRLGQQASTTDLGLDTTAGLIDLFIALDEALPAEPATSEESADAAVAAAFSSIPFERFIADTGIPRLNIVRAGRNDDGQYSRRVNTFNWEALFRRAPTVYRRFAERLAQTFRYVLIDSRTGVSDISGICTSLLPEKLVVVFTPNRQSLTGVRELVERATTYRKGSDDLRPLLVYPLPSRIEASLEDQRANWRFGSRDLNIVGYQPMFQEVLAKVYALPRCDLNPYFDEVQIQQTPDYAYGEEIAVRRGSDRFSLANSYRVFVERLAGGAPPWTVADEPPALLELPQAAPAPKATPALAAPKPAVETRPAELPSAGTTIFLSYAREDRDRVAPIAAAFKAHGWKVWFDVDVAPGAEFTRVVTQALDASDAVVVCWSRNSLRSQSVLDEAAEGLRRGVLVPVLLDDVAPPLGFRYVQSADLRREDSRSLKTLADAVDVVARGRPGSTAVPASMAGADPRGVQKPSSRVSAVVIGGSMAALLVLAVLVVPRWLQRAGPSQPPPVDGAGNVSTSTTTVPPTTPVNVLTVPNLVGVPTVDARKTADVINVSLIMRDDAGNESPFLEGVVNAQTPQPGTQVPLGTRIQLTVATSTVTVPTVVGSTLNAALATLERARLKLGKTESRVVRDVRAGTIIGQTPGPAAKVAAGSQVDVVVATSPPVQAPGEPLSNRDELFRVLLRYQDAYKNRSIGQLLAIYPSLRAEDRKTVELAFGRDCSAYDVTFANPKYVAPEGKMDSLLAADRATVNADVTYTCTRAQERRRVSTTRHEVFQMRRAAGGWQIERVSATKPYAPSAR